MNDKAVKCNKIFGKDLARSDLEVINRIREKEFNSSSLINPQPDNDDWNKLYFLVKDANGLLAFGRLHDVKIEFDEIEYEIYGIATIAAVIKGKGYGRILMKCMREFIRNSGKTAIGFCDRKLSDFYRKTGYGILHASGERFLYKDGNGNLIPSEYGNDDVFFFEGVDAFISKFHNNQDKIVILSRKHW